ncbi:MAG: Ppx/GppA family phosphatase [Ignavibacteria bacterium]|nr:Ppx/GppA family phosphatase [Ignavibacteria bacterium]
MPFKDAPRLAAIDIGTNSFHMIVAAVRANGTFTVLGREKEVVRLGEGSTDMKHLSDAAITRGIAVLKRFKLIAENHGAEIRAVATSAVREALNREAFVERVRRDIGVAVDVVSGFEEARLIYLGVLQALPVFHKRALLVDIGGGSTEFLLGKAGAVHFANSLKLGAVRLTNRFFSGKTLRQKDVDECRTWIAGALDPVQRDLRGREIDIVVGSSGTILTMASMIHATQGRDVDADEGGLVIAKKDLRRVVAELLAADTTAKRRLIPGLDPARADIVVAGALLLERVFDSLGIKEMVTSKYALREGLLLDTIQKKSGDERAVARLRDIRKASVRELTETCRAEPRHAAAVTRYALEIFDQTHDLHGLGNTEREHLEAAAMLHDIGYHISHSLHHRHSYYIIRHAEMLGFTEGEKERIANVARYHRKSHPRIKHENFAPLSERDKDVVRKLSAILRVADGLDRRHRGLFNTILCLQRGRTMVFQVATARHTDTSLELWGAERRKELFEEVFGLHAVFELAPA